MIGSLSGRTAEPHVDYRPLPAYVRHNGRSKLDRSEPCSCPVCYNYLRYLTCVSTPPTPPPIRLEDMSSPQWQTQVVPARLSFLAIYNPSLGLTDETFKEQAVFYYSRKAHEARLAVRKKARSDAGDGGALREEENEKLRQIGLAQGMIDFAR